MLYYEARTNSSLKEGTVSSRDNTAHLSRQAKPPVMSLGKIERLYSLEDDWPPLRHMLNVRSVRLAPTSARGGRGGGRCGLRAACGELERTVP